MPGIPLQRKQLSGTSVTGGSCVTVVTRLHSVILPFRLITDVSYGPTCDPRWFQREVHRVLLDSSGRRTYKRLLRAAATDANGAGLLQEVEVFLLELETFHTAFQAHNS